MTPTQLIPADRGPTEVERPAEGDQPFVSVSTILHVIDKPALVAWAANETADAAIEMGGQALDTLIDKMGVDEVRNTLSRARFRGPGPGRKSAKDLGSAVHQACEVYALTGERPEIDDPEVGVFVDRFEEWCDKAQPTYTAAELTVYHPTFGYAGTADCFLDLDGLPVIGDYKTTRKGHDDRGKPTHPWPEAALQLAGLRYAEMAATWRARRYGPTWNSRVYLLSADELAMADPVPPVEAGVIIHITPEACAAYPMVCDERVYETFLHCLELYRWNDGLAKVAVGPAIEYPPSR